MIDFNKTVKANAITSITLVGYINTKFPRKHGNCFSVRAETGEYRIINFNHENLEELLRTKVVSFPFTIIPLEHSKTAMIADERIPNEWYNDNFCSSCTPIEHLPPVQRLKQVLDIKRGKRTEREVTFYDGTKSIMISFKI